jgi:hypothetical protein
LSSASLNANAASDTFPGFYAPEQLPQKPMQLERALRATVRLETQLSGMGNCSAVLLSKSGYVATAMHCLKHLMNGTMEYPTPVPHVNYERPGFYSFIKILNSKPQIHEAPAYLKDVYYI